MLGADGDEWSKGWTNQQVASRDFPSNLISKVDDDNQSIITLIIINSSSTKANKCRYHTEKCLIIRSIV